MSDNYGPDERRFNPAQYIEPNSPANATSEWVLPEAEQILQDIRACRYSIGTLTDAVIGYSSNSSELALLSSIIDTLKGTPGAYDDFRKYQTIAEEAELILIEETLRRKALGGEDIAATKFFLERRAPDRYGARSKDVGDPVADQIKNLVEGLKGGSK